MDKADNGDLTVDAVEKASLPELMRLAAQANLEMNFKTTPELQQRLRLEAMNRSKTVIDACWYTQEFRQKKEATLKEDVHRRQALEQHLEEVETVHAEIRQLAKVVEPAQGGLGHRSKDDPLLAKMMSEIPDVANQLVQMADFLKRSSRCSLLVCGDSGAGKSSFINLLIGMPVLPTSIRSNSSCQVKLMAARSNNNDETEEYADIIDNDDVQHIIPKNEFGEKLRSFLENKNEREKKTCKKATIYLHTAVLEGGLDIYDTIGLGENEKFNEDLQKDLKDITGAIFLLKRNNPIGDNTVGGLTQIINHMFRNGLPGGSMNFIINMCDLLEHSDKMQLKENVKTQLRSKCTNRIPSEISTFSTINELYLQKHDRMSEEYAQIMNQIQSLHLNSICTDSVRVFDFLFAFTQKTITNIKNLEKLSGLEKSKRKSHIIQMRQLESDRKSLNSSYWRNTEKLLKRKREEAINELNNHFRNPEVKEQVVHQVILNQNYLYNQGGIETIDAKIAQITQDKIVENFEKFNETNQMLKKLCDDLLQNFMTQFAEHEKKKEEIQQIVDGHIHNVMSIIHGDITEMDLNQILRLPSHQRSMLNTFTPLLAPIIKTKSLFTSSVGMWFGFMNRYFNETNLSQFYSDTDGYVRNRASTKYVNFTKQRKNVAAIINFLFDAPKQASLDFKQYLNEDMESLANDIQVFEDDMRNQDKVFQTYKEIKRKLKAIYEKLCQFSLIFLQRDQYHVMESSIQRTDCELLKMDQTIPSLNSHKEYMGEEVKPIVGNRSRVIYQVRFTDPLCPAHSTGIDHSSSNKGSIAGSIIVFKKSKEKNWKHIHQECIHHRNLPQNVSGVFVHLDRKVIFSFLDSNLGSPNLLTFFTVPLISLRHSFYEYKQQKHLNKVLFTHLSRLLRQICSGLDYLHKLTLVHCDLSVDSIAYHMDSASVKLTTITKPCRLYIDPTIRNWKQVLQVAHLPASLLKGATSIDCLSQVKYVLESDIYCLGSVIYHLWYGVNPFYNEVTENVNTVPEFLKVINVPTGNGPPQDTIRSNNRHFERLIAGEESNDPYSDQIRTWTVLCLENKINISRLLTEVNHKKDRGEVHVDQLRWNCNDD